MEYTERERQIAQELVAALRKQVQVERLRAQQCQAQMERMKVKTASAGSPGSLPPTTLDPELVGRLEQAMSQISSGKSRLASLVNSLESVKQEVKHVHKPSQQDQSRVKELERENSRLENEMAQMEQQMAQLVYTRTLAESTRTPQSQDPELRALQQSLEAAEARAATAQAELASLQTEAGQREVANTNLISQNIKLTAENEALVSQLTEAMTNTAVMQVELASLRMGTSKVGAVSAQLKAENDEWIAMNDTLRSQLTDARSSNVVAQDMVVELESQVARLQVELEESKELSSTLRALQAGDHQNTVNDLQAQLQQQETDLANLRTELVSKQELEKQVLETEDREARSREQIRALEATVSSQASIMETQRGELAALRKQDMVPRTQVEELEVQIGEATQALSASQRRLLAAEQEMADLRSAQREGLEAVRLAQDRTRELEASKQHVHTLEAQLMELQETGGPKAAELEAALLSSGRKFDSMMKERGVTIEELELSKSALQTEVARMQKVMAEKEAQAGSLEHRVRTLAEENRRLGGSLEDLQSRYDQLHATMDAAEAATAAAEVARRTMAAELADALVKQKEEGDLVRQLNDQVLELKGNIRVFCRVRPLIEGEQGRLQLNDGTERSVLSFPTGMETPHEIAVHRREALEVQSFDRNNFKVSEIRHVFGFDKVFAPTASQAEVFHEISGLVRSTLHGKRVCIFAYGQTGSGKTFTMLGDHTGEGRGVIPRALELVFERRRQMAEQGWVFKMHASMLEIYNETVRDLLVEGTGSSSEGSGLAPFLAKTPGARAPYTITHDSVGNTYVQDLVIQEVSTSGDVQSLMAQAAKYRSSGATDLNEFSSRSHCVFTLRIVGENAEAAGGFTKTCGILNLIDLAGSERLSRSNPTAERLKETQAINKSLSALGDVVAALVRKDPHIPYRNSKLTYLLQPCLGGSSKTLMFLNMSPSSASAPETLCSARFGEKAMGAELAALSGAKSKVASTINSNSSPRWQRPASASMAGRSRGVVADNEDRVAPLVGKLTFTQSPSKELRLGSTAPTP